MINQSHCRFFCTRIALQECYEHIEDVLSPEEHRERLKLLGLIRQMQGEFPDPELDEQLKQAHGDAKQI